MINKRKLIGSFVTGVLITVGVFFLNRQMNQYGIAHCLCNGFFVAAAMLLGTGGLKFARNGGAFDMISYGVGSVFRITFPWVKAKDHDFAEYKQRKQAERTGYAHLLLSGAVFLALAVICLVIYLNL